MTYHSDFLISGLATRIFQVFGRAVLLQGCSALCLRCAEGGADAADAQSSVANRDSCRDRPAAVRHMGEAATGGSACCHWPDAGALDADILMERSTKKAGIRSSWKSWDCHMSQMSQQFTIFYHFNFCSPAVFVAVLRFVEGLVFIYHKFRAPDMSFPHKLRWNFEVLIFARQPGTVATPTSRTFGMAGD